MSVPLNDHKMIIALLTSKDFILLSFLPNATLEYEIVINLLLLLKFFLLFIYPLHC